MTDNRQIGVLIIVENLPVPFDRRVWQEATTLRQEGYVVSIICPVGKGYKKRYEEIEGIHIYRHPLPIEGDGLGGYIGEYAVALSWEFYLTWKVFFKHGFDAIHACNPPDLIFLIGAFFKCLMGKKFIFDHHDINPELYLAKFGKKDLLYKLITLLEKLSFYVSDISIATNMSYRDIAIDRGRRSPEKVFVVRSGPDLQKMRSVPQNPALKSGKKYMVGYVGVMGKQEGLDLLLKSVHRILYVNHRTDIKFVLIGSGTELENLKKISSDLELDRYVEFTGRISDALLLEYLSTCDICVNPDIANEMNDKSTMNKIMEYMALSKPIVQFDLTEGRFTAQDASLYAKRNDEIDFAEKILFLVDHEEARNHMGEFGLKRVREHLHWGVEKSKLISAYQTLFPLKNISMT
ncbi:MAG: glycosyltransferase family 4 protein [Candidatus Manganitrophaceae bacterium]